MINKDYQYTAFYQDVDDFIPDPESSYLYGTASKEQRCLVDKFKEKYGDSLNFVCLELCDNNSLRVQNHSEIYNLKSSKNINKLIDLHFLNKIYIDVSALDVRISAALLNNLLQNRKDIIVKTIYVEPLCYEIVKFEEEGEGVHNTLCEQIGGIDPLPGFISIFPDNENTKFIPLLGFEGGRLIHLLEAEQPLRDSIIPILGVPGYRPEYPFIALWNNRIPLQDTQSWENMQFASANSIVDICFLLKNELEKSPKCKLKIAPVGTTPHTIGAILFAIKHKLKFVELVYDNPKREICKTFGIGQIIETNISKLYINI